MARPWCAGPLGQTSRARAWPAPTTTVASIPGAGQGVPDVQRHHGRHDCPGWGLGAALRQQQLQGPAAACAPAHRRLLLEVPADLPLPPALPAPLPAPCAQPPTSTLWEPTCCLQPTSTPPCSSRCRAPTPWASTRVGGRAAGGIAVGSQRGCLGRGAAWGGSRPARQQQKHHAGTAHATACHSGLGGRHGAPPCLRRTAPSAACLHPCRPRHRPHQQDRDFHRHHAAPV